VLLRLRVIKHQLDYYYYYYYYYYYTSRDLQLEDGKGTISYVSEYVCLGVSITKDGNHEPEIDRINKGRAATSKLNSVLWDRDVASETKTHIYHATVKSTITYAAETWCLKAKTVAKLNSADVEFGDAQLEFPGRTKLVILL
jgi:hypothetical protein